VFEGVLVAISPGAEKLRNVARCRGIHGTLQSPEATPIAQQGITVAYVSHNNSRAYR